MKKLMYLIIIVLISSLVLTGCSLLSNVGQVPTTEESGMINLTKGSPFEVGNDAAPRTVIDGRTKFTVIDTNNPSSALGLLTTFSYYAVNTYPFSFVLVDGNVVKWVSDPITPPGIGVQSWPSLTPVYVEPGWNLGLYFTSTGTVPFEYGGAPAYYTGGGSVLPAVGNILSYETPTNRIYSFLATGDVAATITWTGQGSDSMNCDPESFDENRTEDGWIHWVLNQAKDVTELAQLVLEGTGSGTYLPTKITPGGVIHFFTPYFDLEDLIAYVNYSGSLGKNSQFVISDYCPAVPTMPTIDGILSPGEWDCATEIPVEDDMAIVKILATVDYLYVSFDVLDSTDDRLGLPRANDEISININPTDGAPWGMPCDIIFKTGSNPALWGTSSGQTDGWETEWKIDGVQQLSLPGDLETKTLYDGVNRVSEWKIPLTSMNLAPGDVFKVGGSISTDVLAYTNYVYPDDLDPAWADASTYEDILVY